MWFAVVPLIPCSLSAPRFLVGVGSFQQRGAQACAELGSLVGLAHHTSRWTTGPERWVTPQTVDSSLCPVSFFRKESVRIPPVGP